MANSSTTDAPVYAPPWVGEPNTRGTWDIIYSCLFTLTLCVYSAIHLNIPRHGELERTQSLRKTKWVIIAIFAPEVVLFTAWQQFYAAKRFCWTMENIRREKAGEPSAIKCYWWEVFEESFKKLMPPPSKEDEEDTDEKGSTEPKKEKDASEKDASNESKSAGEVPEIKVSSEDKEEKKDEETQDTTVPLEGKKEEKHTNGKALTESKADNGVQDQTTTGEAEGDKESAEENPPNEIQNGKESPNQQIAAEGEQGEDKTKSNNPTESEETQSTPPSNSEKNEKTKGSSSSNAFSMTYGFYVVMGGLVVDVSDIYDDIKYMTLTPSGVIELAKTCSTDDFFVKDQTIRDKSKADNLAKGLVLLQVLWALGQCISRFSLGYPVSVLEVHTLVHACCALLMYALWFRKPLNVREAMIIDTTNFKDNLALQLVRMQSSASKSFFNFRIPDSCVRSSSLDGPLDSAEQRTLYPSKNAASEASYMVFDKIALNREPRQNSETEPRAKLAITQIVEDPTDSGIQHRVPPLELFRSDGRDPQDIESGAGKSRKQKMPNETFLKEPAAFYRTPPPDVEIVQTLVTGETFPSGVGPDAILSEKKYVSQPDAVQKLVTRIFERFKKSCGDVKGLRRLVKEKPSVDISQTQLDKKVQTLYPSTKRSKAMRTPVWHRMAISLSAKDVVRWERALNAFKIEQNYKPKEIKSTTDGTAESAPSDNDRSQSKKSDDDTATDQTKFLRVSQDGFNDGMSQMSSETMVDQTHLSSDTTSTAASKSAETLILDEDSRSSKTLSVPQFEPAAQGGTAAKDALTEESDSSAKDISTEENDNLAKEDSTKEKASSAKGDSTDEKDSPKKDDSTDVDNTSTEKSRRHKDIVGFVGYRSKGNPFSDLEVCCKRATNFNGDAIPGSSPDFPKPGAEVINMLSAMTTVSAAYAGIHLALWNHVFPTKAEDILWKFSACCLGIPVAVWAVFLIIAAFVVIGVWVLAWIISFMERSPRKSVRDLVPGIRRFLENVKDRWNAAYTVISRFVEHYCVLECFLMSILYLGIGFFFLLVGAAAISYGFARVYIVVESFISIRFVPLGVYQEISWSSYIPHL